jgi:hypothetical protein
MTEDLKPPLPDLIGSCACVGVQCEHGAQLHRPCRPPLTATTTTVATLCIGDSSSSISIIISISSSSSRTDFTCKNVTGTTTSTNSSIASVVTSTSTNSSIASVVYINNVFALE